MQHPTNTLLVKLKKLSWSLGIEDRGSPEKMLETILPKVIKEKEGNYLPDVHWQKALLLVSSYNIILLTYVDKNLSA